MSDSLNPGFSACSKTHRNCIQQPFKRGGGGGDLVKVRVAASPSRLCKAPRSPEMVSLDHAPAISVAYLSAQAFTHWGSCNISACQTLWCRCMTAPLPPPCVPFPMQGLALMSVPVQSTNIWVGRVIAKNFKGWKRGLMAGN